MTGNNGHENPTTQAVEVTFSEAELIVVKLGLDILACVDEPRVGQILDDEANAIADENISVEEWKTTIQDSAARIKERLDE